MEVAIRREAIGNYFLQNFSVALEEGDWSIGFGYRVVRFVWFGNNDYFGFCPRVMTEAEGGCENIEDEVGLRRESPFHQLVSDPGGAGSRSIGRTAEGEFHLTFCDLIEGTSGRGLTR